MDIRIASVKYRLADDGVVAHNDNYLVTRTWQAVTKSTVGWMNSFWKNKWVKCHIDLEIDGSVVASTDRTLLAEGKTGEIPWRFVEEFVDQRGDIHYAAVVFKDGKIMRGASFEVTMYLLQELYL